MPHSFHKKHARWLSSLCVLCFAGSIFAETPVNQIVEEFNAMNPELKLLIEPVKESQLPADASAMVSLDQTATPRKLMTPLQVLAKLESNIIQLSQSAVQNLYNSFVKNNYYRKRKALVRSFEQFTICPEEAQYITKRLPQAKAAIKKVIGIDLSPNDVPHVAVCLSGGGMRAALGASGALEELDKQGFLDFVIWVATLSGSTWGLAPYAINDLRYKDFAPLFRQRAQNTIIAKPLDEEIKMLFQMGNAFTDALARDLIFGDTPSVIEVYGILLALSFFSKEEIGRYLSISLDSMVPFVSEGQKPLPIFTANAPDEDKLNYYHFEFTPYEVAAYALKCAVASWAWGREFKKGISVTAPPPVPLGKAMGIFGSAVSLSTKDIYNHVLRKLKPEFIFKKMREITDIPQFGSLRMFPTTQHNFAYKMPGSPAENKPDLTFVDAGMTFGVPLHPLLHRYPDVILIFDFSANVADGDELFKAEAYARTHNLPFPHIDHSLRSENPRVLNITEEVFSVYDDGPESSAPIVIYFPMLKNPNFSKTFDPRAEMGTTGFLNTFNFLYGQREVDLISGLFKQAVIDAKSTIIDTIKTAIERKRQSTKTSVAPDIFEAVKTNNVSLVNKILAKNPDAMKVRDQEGRIPLYYAGNKLEIVKTFHDHGANLSFEKDVLMENAAGSNSKDVIDYLVSQGIRITPRAIVTAQEQKHPDLVTYLVDKLKTQRR